MRGVGSLPLDEHEVVPLGKTLDKERKASKEDTLPVFASGQFLPLK